jgi:hypothetical protein
MINAKHLLQGYQEQLGKYMSRIGMEQHDTYMCFYDMSCGDKRITKVEIGTRGVAKRAIPTILKYFKKEEAK